ncbi:hypothetical protein P153DRAFT_367702 [Dothidotthia symphoricarpi CBS 119687]|uniref:Uncharacterized protein n=1 Tax=Dothidotthia symphoricarpi CBS 119687 TaxID=1392245 RepID=A0A6A6ACF3_9PLEO|nr:uncharacterized protein P153DRAFT_367702 [Dothidotthia symphoricarpi CBS 119687]KAF2128588.1 hypothetical protein P153DRAFT_367702 [Dothidotthia symphoricarpi CBS 119687]
METQTHQEVKHAYNSHPPVHHSDKTSQLIPSVHASHSACFREVQEALELARRDGETDEEMTSSNRSYQFRTKLEAPSMFKATANQQVEYLRAQRTKQDAEDEELNDDGLKSMLQAWKDLAIENKLDPQIHAYCATQVLEYKTKVADREREHICKERLANSSVSKDVSPTPPIVHQNTATPDGLKKQNATGSGPFTPLASTCPTPKPVCALTKKGEDRKRAKVEQAERSAEKAEARMQEKAQRETAKQAHLNHKVAAVRAEKEKQKARMEQQNEREVERIARVRAKAGAPPLGMVGANIGNRSAAFGIDVSSRVGSVGSSIGSSATISDAHVATTKICTTCSLTHSTFREWKMCGMRAADQ